LSTTDGPFAETREHLGGFLLIEARDMTEAVQVAASAPMAEVGCVEVRAVDDGHVFERTVSQAPTELTQYTCLVYLEEHTLNAQPPAELDELARANQAYAEELERTGRMRAAAALHSVATAVTVRVRNRKLSTTDGPFAETREQLAGFFVMEARDL